MTPPPLDPLAGLRASVDAAANELRGGDDGERHAEPTLERPPKVDFGDYSTNAAMLLAPLLGEPPRAIAERLGAVLETSLGEQLERLDVAGPGFLNLHLADDWFVDALGHLLVAGADFGSRRADPTRRVLIEFVSANPTGPLTAAGGRHAAYGDAIARLLEFAGHTVEREYYVNDYGSQVLRLGMSIGARARDEPVPEDGYSGDYVAELAVAISHAERLAPDELARRGVELLLERIRTTLTRFRVDFDTWFSERSLHAGTVAETLEELRRGDHVYEHESATWLRTTHFGDDKDRVLRRSNGDYTYFASDIAYHQHKVQRGFDLLIDVWGADHHGYAPRMKAAFQALGGDPDGLELLIMQFVNLLERGERAAMSKRRGDFVTLDELVDEIGVDAARWFMLQRSHDTTVDLDLDLARDQSNENPVYYVQYAHARSCSVLAKAGQRRVAEALAAVGSSGAALTVAAAPLEQAERALIKKLLAFPTEMEEAAARRAPHRVAGYALELAQTFTAFYRDCKVVGAEPAETETLRIALCAVAGRTIARSLDLLGVTAPEKMERLDPTEI